MTAKGEPLTLFCAAMEALAAEGRDGVVDAERAMMRRVITDEAAWENGRRWLADHSERELLQQLPEVLDGSQRVCLFANLAALSLADGFLGEAGILSRFRMALKVHSYDADQALRAWKIAHNVRVFDSLTLDGDAALMVLTAALLAMAHSDFEMSEMEESLVKRVVSDPQALRAGWELYLRLGDDGVMEKIAMMTQEQKRCLFANLIAMMMADGLWKDREQIFLGRAIERLGIVRRVADNLLKGIHARYNTVVFA